MVNSLTKSDCLILTVIIPLQVLLNFKIVYSPSPSTRHQGTFRASDGERGVASRAFANREQEDKDRVEGVSSRHQKMSRTQKIRTQCYCSSIQQFP
jgi:hypothetical protein